MATGNRVDMGRYQNDIPELDKLDYIRYENIFKLYEQTAGDKKFYIYNILNKIIFPKNIPDEYTDIYEVNTKKALTIISYEIYENIESWWILYLMNRDKMGLFYIKPGVKLKYIKPGYLGLIYDQIKANQIK